MLQFGLDRMQAMTTQIRNQKPGSYSTSAHQIDIPATYSTGTAITVATIHGQRGRGVCNSVSPIAQDPETRSDRACDK